MFGDSVFGTFQLIEATGRCVTVAESVLEPAVDIAHRGLTYAHIVAIDVRDLSSGLWFLAKVKILVRLYLMHE